MDIFKQNVLTITTGSTTQELRLSHSYIQKKAVDLLDLLISSNKHAECTAGTLTITKIVSIICIII